MYEQSATQAISAIGSGGYGNGGAAVQQTGIGGYTQELQSAISELTDRVDHLEKALGSVLTPQPPQPAQNDKLAATGPVRSHVAGSVIDARCRVDGLSRRVEHLIGRLEL